MDYRDMPQESGIYMIKNLVNDKMYIGQAKNIKTRIYQHTQAARNGNPLHLYNSIRKYGIDRFAVVILESCGAHLLNERETFWINQYKATRRGYNICAFGESPRRGIAWTKKQILSKTGQTAPVRVTVYDSEQDTIKRFISFTSAANHLNVNFGLPAIFKVHGCTLVRWRYLIIRGNPSLISARNKYNKHRLRCSPSANAKKGGEKRSKPVIKLDLEYNVLNKYKNMGEAAKEIKTAPSNLFHAVKNKRKCKGFYWRYAQEETPAQ